MIATSPATRTQEQELLVMLRTGPKTTHELCQTALAREYPRCIWRLRHRLGYGITATRLSNTCWQFTLVAEPALVQPELFGT